MNMLLMKSARQVTMREKVEEKKDYFLKFCFAFFAVSGKFGEIN